ncbi:MAG: DinB family protein, partial [Dokdonella sp.]
MSQSQDETATLADLHILYRDVRAATLALASPLSAEDQCIQSMPDASPTKWHLAHTSWFFETVVLLRHSPRYRAFDTRFNYLFNSYYEALGPRHARPQRGLITRPSLDEVRAYRAHVDLGIDALLREQQAQSSEVWNEIAATITLGLNHEQQHQELLLTDILHAFSMNPLLPAYHDAGTANTCASSPTPELHWLEQPGGIVEIGHDGTGFAFDSETPRHEALLRPYAIANRLVTCGDY